MTAFGSVTVRGGNKNGGGVHDICGANAHPCASHKWYFSFPSCRSVRYVIAASFSCHKEKDTPTKCIQNQQPIEHQLVNLGILGAKIWGPNLGLKIGVEKRGCWVYFLLGQKHLLGNGRFWSNIIIIQFSLITFVGNESPKIVFIIVSIIWLAIAKSKFGMPHNPK